MGCAAVVAGLAILAAPAVPTAVDVVGGLLRTASAQQMTAPAAPRPIESIGTALSDDCRSLYPDALWVHLTWQRHVILDQSQDAPATTATAVRDALHPAVLMTCHWRNRAGGTISTTLSGIDGADVQIAHAGLAGAGFSCSASGDGIRCTHSAGAVTEEEVVRDGMWLSTTTTSWQLDGYTDELVGRLWP